MTLFLWFLGLHVLLGLIAGEYVIQEVKTKPKPSGLSEKEYQELMEGIQHRSARVGIRIVCMCLGFVSFLLVAASGLSSVLRKKRS